MTDHKHARKAFLSSAMQSKFFRHDFHADIGLDPDADRPRFIRWLDDFAGPLLDQTKVEHDFTRGFNLLEI